MQDILKIKEKVTDLVRNKKTQLPTLPVIVNKILTIAAEENTSAQDLAGFISNDQALTNKILRLSNSAYYGQMKQVDSIQRAVTVIGFNEVVGLTIGMSVFASFKDSPVHKVFDLQDLWIHSIGCATAAKEISLQTDSKAAEQLFLNGLLHDMGKVIFAVYFPKEYRAVLEHTNQNEAFLFFTERQMLDIDHAALSGLLMERWRFPESLIFPCRFHHDPTHCPEDYKRHAMIVGLADYLCYQAGIGNGGSPAPHMPATSVQELMISDKDLKKLFEVLEEKRTSIQEFFELMK